MATWFIVLPIGNGHETAYNFQNNLRTIWALRSMDYAQQTQYR